MAKVNQWVEPAGKWVTFTFDRSGGLPLLDWGSVYFLLTDEIAAEMWHC